MPQQIKVAEVFTKPTAKGGLFVKVTDDKGASFSGFDEGLAKLNKGDVIQAEIVIEGKYTNIKSWTLAEKAEAPKTPAPATPAPSGSRETSIEAQVVAKIISDLLANGIIDLNHKWAKGLGNYIEARIPCKESEEATKPELVQAIENLTGAKAELLPKLETAGDLANAITKFGKDYTPSWICQQLGVERLAQIADRKAAYSQLVEIIKGTLTK
jgi:hypothetical protein